MQFAEIVPWGRSFDEYVAMFALSEADLGRRMLGCGDGPASFNAGATLRGAEVISVDPIYAFPGDTIAARIAEVRPQIEAELRARALPLDPLRRRRRPGAHAPRRHGPLP
jgi:hypothetical protein